MPTKKHKKLDERDLFHQLGHTSGRNNMDCATCGLRWEEFRDRLVDEKCPSTKRVSPYD